MAHGMPRYKGGDLGWDREPVRPVTAADRPSVTDNARAEALEDAAAQFDHLYRDGLMPKRAVLADLAEWADRARRGLRANGHPYRAAGRAETTTATATLMARRGGKTQALIESLLAQAKDRGLTVEVVYPETTTATDEDALADLAHLILDTLHFEPSTRDAEMDNVMGILRRHLLATARTRPTRDDVSDAIEHSGIAIGTSDAERAADAVLALLRGGDRDE